MRMLALGFVCLAAACHSTGAGRLAAAPLALVDATVLTMDGRALEHHDVVVAGDTIVSLAPTGKAAGGARRIDCAGKFVMPGLADGHAHLAPGAGTLVDSAGRQLALYLANGFTSVRSLGAMKGADPIGLRERLRRGELTGPALIAAAPSINGQTVHSPQEAASKVREAKAAGFDLIKTHGGFDRETYDAMIGAAREAGLRVSGHVTSGYGLLHALESGQQVEHLDGYMAALMDEPHPAWDQQIVPDPDLLSQVHEDRMPALARKTREAGITNGPTLALFEQIASDTPSSTLAAWPEMRYAPRQAREAWTKQIDGIRAEHWDKAAMQRFVDLRRAMVRALSDAGAPLLVGSDSPQFFLLPGFSAHREMEALEKAGIPTAKVLTAATVELARWAGQDGTWGTVAEGKRADLLVLDADPRETVANTRRIAGLVLHGKWLSHADLDKLLEDVASAAAQG